jgi:lipoate-protein ligase A
VTSSPAISHPAEEWWFVYSGEGDADWNMAVDEWLLATAPSRPPVLRLYGWARPTVSLGRNERWRDVVDLGRLGEAGVSLVRRPTGGRAVLHDREITYSVTSPSGTGDAWTARLETALARVSGALVRGLGKLGVAARFSRRGAGPAQTPGMGPGGSPLCFESVTRYELLAGDVKVVGSAQCRTERAFLQHGSIPLAPALAALWRLGPRNRPCPEEQPPPGGLAALRCRPHEELCRELAAGFEDELGRPGLWRGEEILDGPQVRALVEAKYAADGWTLRR